MPSAPTTCDPHARAVAFLDVDGTFSPLGADLPDTWGDWEPLPGVGFRAATSPAMADRLARLDCDVVWLSTWEQLTEAINHRYGWNYPWLSRRSAGRERVWKVDAALRWLTEHGPRPVLWFDDDLRRFRTAARDALTRLGCPHRLVIPNPGDGLTPSHLDEAARWLTDAA